MSITVEAIYESGILKPLAPLPELADKSRVRVTIEPAGNWNIGAWSVIAVTKRLNIAAKLATPTIRPAAWGRAIRSAQPSRDARPRLPILPETRR